MAVAGGRLFVDVTQRLASPTSGAELLELMGKSDPLIGDAVQTILSADGFIRSLPTRGPRPLAGGAPDPIETDPGIVTELIERTEASIAAVKHDIRTKSGSALFDFILEDIQELKRILFDPRSHQVIMAAMEATWWLNEQLQAWLSERTQPTHSHDPSPQRHVGDGAGASGRRRRDPATPGGGGFPRTRRG